MDKSLITKSDYKKGVNCLKSLWLTKNNQELIQQTVNNELEDIILVKKHARKLYPNGIDVADGSSMEFMLEETKKLMESKKVIYNGKFQTEDISIKTDIINPVENGYELYQVKIKSTLKKEDIEPIVDELSIQKYVLDVLGYAINKVALIHINSHYIRGTELIPEEFLKITDFTDKIEKNDKIAKNIEAMKIAMNQKEEYTQDIGQYCLKPRECEFKTYCWKNIPENTVFNLSGMQARTQFKMYEKGIINFEDLIKEKSIKDKYKMQIDAELNNTEYINKENIKAFMDTLSYPIYFLDFETFQQTIPEYEGIKPYQQIPFQYSVHYLENEESELKHIEFLAKEGVNPREEIAKSLLDNIPTNACIVVYNERFEKQMLKELAIDYKEFEEHLMKLRDNVKDLMVVFSKRDYYTKDMKGSHSIKYVLPALIKENDELDYKKLNIQNGSMAMDIFAKLHTKTASEIENTRKDLLEYCKLDTLAMVKIWEKLKEEINDIGVKESC